MSMWLRQSTASQEILLGRFVDSLDGNTEETALTIANTDIKLWVEGATTLASKNSGGATHIANGMYYAVLDATDTATLGKLEVCVHVAGALPIRREYMVLPAMVYDSLVLGTDRFDVNVTHVADTSQTARDIGASVLISSGTGTGQLSVSSGVIAANVTQIDAQATNGNNATLNLKQLNIVNSAGSAIVASSTGSNGHGMAISGNGSGEGISATGGATGHGAEFIGGATSGTGFYVRGAGASAIGFRAVATGSQPGASFESTGGNGSGLLCYGAGTGSGIYATTDGNGPGFYCESTSGGPGIGCAGNMEIGGDLAITGNLSADNMICNLFAPTSIVATNVTVSNDVIVSRDFTITRNFTVSGSVVGTFDANTVKVNGTNQTAGDIYGALNNGTYGLVALQTALGTALSGIVTIVADTNELQTDWANGGRLDLLVDGIKAKTDNLPAAPAATSDIPSAAANATAVLTTAMTESYAADGATMTLAQAAYMLWSALSEFSISGTTITEKKLDGSTTAMTHTLNDATNPTSRTRAT